MSETEAKLPALAHLTGEQRQGMQVEMLQQAEGAVVAAWMNYVRALAAFERLAAEWRRISGE